MGGADLPDEARDMFGSIARAFVSGDRAALAEARANAAGYFDAAQETFGRRSDAASETVAGGLARETILGTWKHALLTVTFAENGRRLSRRSWAPHRRDTGRLMRTGGC